MARSARALVVALLGLVFGVLPLTVGAGRATADTAQGFRFAMTELQASEDQAIVRVVVERTSLPVSRVVVDYRSKDGTATAGEDYREARGALEFAVGASTASFSVLLLEDDAVEPRERVVLHLVDQGTIEEASLSILDNDGAVASGATGGTGVPASGSGTGGTPPSAAAVTSATAPSAATAAVAARPASGAMVRPQPVTRTRPVAAPARRRVTVRQSPVTPFELRPLGPDPRRPTGPGTTVDPVLAVGAGLLLARVAAGVWWRARIAVP